MGFHRYLFGISPSFASPRWGKFAHGKHDLRPGSSAKSRLNGRKGKVQSAQERGGLVPCDILRNAVTRSYRWILQLMVLIKSGQLTFFLWKMIFQPPKQAGSIFYWGVSCIFWNLSSLWNVGRPTCWPPPGGHWEKCCMLPPQQWVPRRCSCKL